jgi:WNK lysine deficient protein kinase
MNGTDRSTDYLPGDVLEKKGARVTYRAMCTSEGAEVCWNQLKLDTSPIPLLQARGIDIQTLLTINHHNILRLRDAWYDESTRIFHYINEYPPPQTLRAYVKNVFGKPSESVLARWCYQIIEALDELHGRRIPIIHRALSCDNIFIDPGDGLIKIGLPALEMVIFSLQNPVAGPADDTREWTIDPKSDIWLFGLCIIEMGTAELPYAEFPSDEERRRAINARQMPRAFGEIHDPLIADLIITCLSQAKVQPTAAQLRENPLFAEFNEGPGSARSRDATDDVPAPREAKEEDPEEKYVREKTELLARHESERIAYLRKLGYKENRSQ